MKMGKNKFDWRIWGVTFLAKDVPAAYPGGPSHKAGDPVFPSSLTRTASKDLIGFIQPRPAALAIHIAIESSLKAVSFRNTLALQSIVTPHGMGKQVVIENHPMLYDYFEYCMIAVAFSAQSLDTFCNETIENYLTGTIPINMNGKMKHLNKVQLQSSHISTRMKLGIIIPKILKIDSPELPQNAVVWNDYLTLERVRNSTLHLKASDENSGVNIDKESLFFEFFRVDATDYPKYAIEMLTYFQPKVQNKDWITEARSILDKSVNPSL